MRETNETNTTESSEELSSLRDSLQRALDDGDLLTAKELKIKIIPQLKAMQGEIDLQSERKKAREIMKENFFGPEEIKKAFDINLGEKDIPKIPFSKEELELAKALNQVLLLRVEKDNNSKALTMKEIQEINSRKGGCIIDVNLLEARDVYLKDAPRPGWALTSGYVPMETRTKNHVQQTEFLVNYLTESVLKGTKIPQEYKEALEEFESDKGLLGKLLNTPPSRLPARAFGGAPPLPSLAADIVSLKINELIRHTAVEIYYDQSLFFLNRGSPLYNAMIFTNSRVGESEYIAALDFRMDERKFASMPCYSKGAMCAVFSRRGIA